ncbi:MAG: stage V sporulation protein AE, partial [Oscillospiraceae bacterium]|nr:stage V sporulation protein AE [Oscillospiraceae bacterium]
MNYLLAFLVGGVLCVIGQLLIDDTKLTPARILVGYVVAGVILGGLGIYPHLVDLAGAGATVPLSGFGNLLAQGIRRDVDANGLLGVLTGGLTSAAGGISAALLFGLLAA